MTGKVYFTDGRVEDIVTHTFDPYNRHELYFMTKSGDYVYSAGNFPITDGTGAILQYVHTYKFYKYTGQWLVTTEIDHVDFNMEVSYE